MFCPNCGKADQSPDSFCRQCGTFLPDFEKIKKKEVSPEQHLKANSFLNLLTAVVSLALAVALYAVFLGRSDTHWIIYLTAGFLTAMCAWQVQTFWRTQLLKRHFRQRRAPGGEEPATSRENLTAKPTRELLEEGAAESYIRPSVIEQTTKDLKTKVKR